MTKTSITRIPDLLFGADYNPEQWDDKTVDEDISLMVQAGVNIVTLPVFAWSRIEPKFEEFDFEWLDAIIDKLWSVGISIDLATATATPPAWMVRQFPEILPVDFYGTKLQFGSRQSYCPSSPIWRQQCARLAKVMVERYAKHPAIAMWHISNEYGDHISRCYCDVSTVDFQQWLAKKYGEISALNQAWGTTSWGQIYTSFEQINSPSKAPGPINPTHTLDFDRFSSDALLELFRCEVDVVRQNSSTIPITTNFMSFFKDLDYWDFAALEDVVSDDAYPDPSDPNAYLDAALNYGLMRSLKPKPWVLLEQAPSAVSWRDVNAPKPPGYMRLFSMQAVAHGSDGVMYFQWRAGRFGTEKFHSAILGHRGIQSRTWEECSALGNELKNMSELVGTRVQTPVAMLADWNSRWALESPEAMPSVGFNWIDLARSWNRSLAKMGLQADVVNYKSDLEAYKMLLVPNAYLISAESAQSLEKYVASGGTLVVGPFSGTVDDNDHVHLGGAPGPLTKLLGISVDEWWPMIDGAVENIRIFDQEFGLKNWSEWLECTTASTLGTYSTGHLKDRPAITANQFEKGLAIYVSADIEVGGLEAILRHAVEAANIKLMFLDLKFGIDATIRTDGTQQYLSVINFSEESFKLADDFLGYDICRQKDFTKSSEVLAKDAVVIRLEKPHVW